MPMSGKSCQRSTRAEEDIITICDDKIYRADFVDPDSTEQMYQISSDLKCFDVEHLEILSGFIALCQSKDSKNIHLLKINQKTMTLDYDYVLEQKEGDTSLIYAESDQSLILEVDQSSMSTNKVMFIHKSNKFQTTEFKMHAFVAKV